MRTPLNIVALSPNAWNGQWVNRQQLLSRIGTEHSIIYSNGNWTVWDRASPEYRQAPWFGSFNRQDNVYLDVPPRLAPRWPRLKLWDGAAIAQAARRWRRQLGNARPLVAYLCHPMYLPYLKSLEADYLVYHCYDWYEGQPGWTPELEHAQRELLHRADLLFSVTTMLSQKLMEKAPCEARLLPNGADVRAIFAAAEAVIEIPADLASIPAPRIGYLGSIHPQLDYLLLYELARRRPEWHFVFVGPEQNTNQLRAVAGFQACVSRPNIHFLGSRHRSEVPAYLLHMHVNVMLYMLTPDTWTHLGHPLKLHEYLACGRPIVSVPLTAIQGFNSVIRIASGVDAWEAALASAISEHSEEQRTQRVARAAENSWESRAQVLQSWLDELPQLRTQRLTRLAMQTDRK